MTKDLKNPLMVFLILLIIVLWSKFNDMSDLNNELESRLSSYENALEQANENINDAKSYAWADYESMGETLDNLETVDIR